LRINVYSCLLLFTKLKKYLVITKFCLGKVFSRVVDFETGVIYRNMKMTRENKTRYILQWVNKSDENVYLNFKKLIDKEKKAMHM